MEHRPPRWDLYPPISPEEIARVQSAMPALGLSPLLAQLLANRDLHEPEAIERFLNPPDVAEYPDPLLMVGMRPALDRICEAIDGGEKIVVYGDFDADGVTSTALLCIALKHFGATVAPYVPHRVNEGYGLNLGALRGIAEQGARLVITVDCGISNRFEAQEASKLGLDLIVTDHHHLPEEMPDTIIINPKQHVDGCEDFECLAGVGVAYQLVRALVKHYGKPATMSKEDLRRMRDNLLGLVAIGTVADMASLRGANRSLVKQGIKALPRHSLPGLPIMLDRAGVKLDSIDTERIGFIIGPRLNAAGRMDDASIAYRLLMTENALEASDLTQKLGAQNRRRQALMNAIADRARERVRGMGDDEIILLHDFNWPSDDGNPLGVVGLVAGKLAEEFGRPALVLAPGVEDGEVRGSARSTRNFDIHEALTQVKDILVHFGGHSAAAGLTVKEQDVEELRRRLCEIARAGKVAGKVEAEPVITADCEIKLSEITDAMLAEINRLAPFGEENPYPLFMAKRVQVRDVSVVGETHLKMLLADGPGTPPLEAIAFRMGYRVGELTRDRRVDILFHIERREWKEETHLQLRVRELRLAV